MSEFARTLWDLLGLSDNHRRARQRRTAVALGQVSPGQRRGVMRQRYDALVEEMKQIYGIRVRTWRRSSSGCAWMVRYADGTVSKLVEAPYPKGPVSCAVFLHEIAHHAIGFGRYQPRCLEEYHAWRWALEVMQAKGLNVTPAVRKRMTDSVRYAVSKAKRRGLKKLPVELQPYV